MASSSPVTRSLSACRVGAIVDVDLEILNDRKNRDRYLWNAIVGYAPFIQTVFVIVSIVISTTALFYSPKITNSYIVLNTVFEVELLLVLTWTAFRTTSCLIIATLTNIAVVWIFETVFVLYTCFVDFSKKCDADDCSTIYGSFHYRLVLAAVHLTFAFGHVFVGVVYIIANVAFDHEQYIIEEIVIRKKIQTEQREKRQKLKNKSQSNLNSKKSMTTTSSTDETRKTEKLNDEQVPKIQDLKNSKKEIVITSISAVEKTQPSKSTESRNSGNPPPPPTSMIKFISKYHATNVIRHPSVPFESAQTSTTPFYSQSARTSSIVPVSDGFFVPTSELTPRRPIYLDNEIGIRELPEDRSTTSSQCSYAF